MDEFKIYTSDISRYLFYITHIDNIPSMLQNGILSHNLIEQENLDYTPIYDREIVSNRKEKMVNGKSLWHFANLYFQPRNPMLYRVTMEKSPDVIAVVAVDKKILDTSNAFITDGNAASEPTKFYPNTNFKIIEKQISRITDLQWWTESNATKRQIMAECLVPERIPPEFIRAIYVSNHELADKIRQSVSSSVSVIPEPSMFFQPVRKIPLTNNLSLVEGDLFFSKMQTLTVSVNCIGIMGKGLASRAKYQFPDVYVYYQDQCKRKTLRMGKPVLYQREGPYHQQIADDPSSLGNRTDTWFLLFATKQHWRDNSDINGIEKGLQWLLDNYERVGIKSLAIPALGCGLGRLRWEDVGPILCKYLSKMDIPVWVYLPAEKQLSNDLLTKEFLLDD
ncbi:Appr-1-p processing protein [Nitrosopumilus zosterae]|uniref:Appr-1-p processing protein n=1 Tax=Nitrosopumilus zosterae TaxID=718286 RepID=A0A2S2KQM6_9ARCH|nr:DarT ssDNA thymidine ADP-ribosyltransferase family protein [Nitrosopumilus zosterae]BDQ30604.1 DarT ssDNA thymidine ADP-ribosyltransferase family protein [Nitrosopumilus zosterae]GBH33963.1 Appr-1-p processing protein [Nitrosopumilus zosterae]